MFDARLDIDVIRQSQSFLDIIVHFALFCNLAINLLIL